MKKIIIILLIILVVNGIVYSDEKDMLKIPILTKEEFDTFCFGVGFSTEQPSKVTSALDGNIYYFEKNDNNNFGQYVVTEHVKEYQYEGNLISSNYFLIYANLSNIDDQIDLSSKISKGSNIGLTHGQSPIIDEKETIIGVYTEEINDFLVFWTKSNPTYSMGVYWYDPTVIFKKYFDVFDYFAYESNNIDDVIKHYKATDSEMLDILGTYETDINVHNPIIKNYRSYFEFTSLPREISEESKEYLQKIALTKKNEKYANYNFEIIEKIEDLNIRFIFSDYLNNYIVDDLKNKNMLYMYYEIPFYNLYTKDIIIVVDEYQYKSIEDYIIYFKNL